MNAQDWQRQLTQLGCLYPYAPGELQYHFVGTSGKHLGGYGCLDNFLSDLRLVWQATGEFATAFGADGDFFVPDEWPEVAAVPAVGEIAMLHSLAQQLVHVLPTSNVEPVWADKLSGTPTQYRFLRPYFAEKIRGRRVLLAVDFCNSAHTLGELAKQVRRIGGRVVGACAVVHNLDVDEIAATVGAPFFGLCRFTYPVWTPEDCLRKGGPCSRRVPIIVDEALGHGRQFRDEHPDWPGRFVQLLPDQFR